VRSIRSEIAWLQETVLAGSCAIYNFPAKETEEISESDIPADEAPWITFLKIEGIYTLFEPNRRNSGSIPVFDRGKTFIYSLS
jgi:hypothetical protein